MESLFRIFDNVVVLDVETTGLNSKKDEIIEFAAQRIVSRAQSFEVEHEVNSLVQLSNGRTLRPEITQLTGITLQMLLQNGESKEKVCNKIIELISQPNTLIAAYNAHFDLSFLYYFLLNFKSANILQKVKMLDVMTVYKDRRDYPHKLENAAKAYDLEVETSHRAIADVKTTLEVLVAMEKEKNDLNKYVNLFGYNPKYGVSGSKISSITYVPQRYDRRKPLYDL